MKNKIRSSLFTGLYLALYATLWLTFFNGVNIYTDRFQNLMTGLYIFMNSIIAILVFCMWVVLYAMDKDPKLKANMKEMAENPKHKDFMNMKKRHNSYLWMAYRYFTFYPAIICAGILLGYYYLAAAMVIDVIILGILRSQIESLREKVS